MEGRTPIAIMKIREEDVHTAVFNALTAIHAEQLFPREGMNILLKPNVLLGKPPERADYYPPACFKGGDSMDQTVQSR